MDKGWFVERLLAWYGEHKRDLPWRLTSDPYRIWLSEIILQQTRVNQGLPYYLKFTDAFPTVEDFARANQEEVLRLWQGLGYYSRARNMLIAAQQVMDEYGGEFPTSYDEVIKLKGVGTYTAAAIASFSSGESVAVLDGNVFRVLSRLYAIDEDILSQKGKRTFLAIANELIPKKGAGEYNQAMMEFGALHCKPTTPDCMFCVMGDRCQARAEGKVSQLPVKIKKLKVKNRYIHYLVITGYNGVSMKQRAGKGIWQGLYDFPLLEQADSFMDVETLTGEMDQLMGSSSYTLVGQYVEKQHILTHQNLKVRFHEIQLDQKHPLHSHSQKSGVQFYTWNQVHSLPKPILIANYLSEKFAISI